MVPLQVGLGTLVMRLTRHPGHRKLRVQDGQQGTLTAAWRCRMAALYLWGVCDPTNKNDTWRSTDKGATWTQMTASAGWTARSGHTSVTLPDGSIVLMGGADGITGNKNDVWRSTDKGVTWTQMTASAGWSARKGHSSVALPDGSIVLMGGVSNNYPYYLNDVWRSTDKGATWTKWPSNAGWSGRNDHSSVAMPDGSIVLMGGYSNKDVWRSTDKGATWIQMTANAGWSARSVHTSVVMPDGSIVLMGGSSNGRMNDVWRSTDNGATWTQLTASAGWSARTSPSSVVIPDGSIVLMGGYDSGGQKKDVWRLTSVGSSIQNPLHIYTQPGTYSVTLQAYNNGGYNSTRKISYITVGAFTNPAPTVTGITPIKGDNSGSVSVTNLAGTGFINGATVKLNRAGQADIEATSVVTVSSTQITCILPITGAATGYWNITVTNPDFQTGTLPNGFMVTASPLPDFTSSVTSGAAPLAVSFTDTSLYSPTGWAWYFGDETYNTPWVREDPLEWCRVDTEMGS